MKRIKVTESHPIIVIENYIEQIFVKTTQLKKVLYFIRNVRGYSETILASVWTYVNYILIIKCIYMVCYNEMK